MSPPRGSDKVTFGMFKGWSFSEVPLWYIDWMQRRMVDPNENQARLLEFHGGSPAAKRRCTCRCAGNNDDDKDGRAGCEGGGSTVGFGASRSIFRKTSLLPRERLC